MTLRSLCDNQRRATPGIPDRGSAATLTTLAGAAVGRRRAGLAIGLACALLTGCGDRGPTSLPSIGMPTANLPSSAPRTFGQTFAPIGSAGAVESGQPIASNPPASPGRPVTIHATRLDLRLPSPRSRAVAVLVGNQLLVCGGLLATGASSGSILAIDVSAGRVVDRGHLASSVHDAGAATLGALTLVVGGGRVGPGSAIQRVTATGATTVGQLPVPRADLGAVVLDGELLVIGGATSGRPDRRVLATTDGVRFRTVATLRVGVRYAAVVTLGGRAYVIGGATPTGDVNLIQAIDPRTGEVRIVGHLPTSLSHASALVVGGAILIAGGRQAGRALATLLRLDPATGSVTRIGRLPYATSDAAAIVVDGVGYLIGGEGGARLLSTIIALTAT